MHWERAAAPTVSSETSNEQWWSPHLHGASTKIGDILRVHLKDSQDPEVRLQILFESLMGDPGSTFSVESNHASIGVLTPGNTCTVNPCFLAMLVNCGMLGDHRLGGLHDCISFTFEWRRVVLLL